MSIKLHNDIRAVLQQMERLEEAMRAEIADLHERMDRIEYRKKPGPKPRRLQEKMND